jgi:hypothetical protein
LDRAIVNEMDAAIEVFMKECWVYVYGNELNITNQRAESVAQRPLLEALLQQAHYTVEGGRFRPFSDPEPCRETLEILKKAVEQYEKRLAAGAGE